jgi:phthalate 4,5-cis-dihydrodiol dehydrogenase
VYGDDAQTFEPVPPPAVPRAEVFDELCDAVEGVRAPIHTGEWARATMEACLAILQSAREQRDVTLTRQIGIGGP